IGAREMDGNRTSPALPAATRSPGLDPGLVQRRVVTDPQRSLLHAATLRLEDDPGGGSRSGVRGEAEEGFLIRLEDPPSPETRPGEGAQRQARPPAAAPRRVPAPRAAQPAVPAPEVVDERSTRKRPGLQGHHVDRVTADAAVSVVHGQHYGVG